MKQICVFIILAIFSLISLAGTDWKTSAIKLSGDPELRSEGLNELKGIRNLSEQLKESFKTDKVLVLQVIRDLKLREFFPRLIEMITNLKAQELTADVVETATLLASEGQAKELTTLYDKKLESPQLADSTALALMLGLQKFNFAIEEAKLIRLLAHPSFEVRIAATEMAAALRKNNPRYDKVLQKALTTSPYQVRLLAYSEYSENAELKKSHRTELNKACRQEKNDEVKTLCQQITGVKK